MFPKSFSDFTFYQKKKDILIYKAADSNEGREEVRWLSFLQVK